MSPYDVIRAPLLSEKAYSRFDRGVYSFWVHPQATRTDVKVAVHQAFSVDVVSVNLQTVRGKVKRVGRTQGQRIGRKKAIVTLKPGQKIAALEGLA